MAGRTLTFAHDRLGREVSRSFGPADRPVTLATKWDGASRIREQTYLTAAIDGEYLSRYRQDGPDPLTVQADAVLPDGLVFAGQPGFLDDGRILAAVAEDPWGDASRLFVLDAVTLRALAEVDYPRRSGQPPLPTGDGTWLTVDGDSVRRWRTV